MMGNIFMCLILVITFILGYFIIDCFTRFLDDIRREKRHRLLP